MSRSLESQEERLVAFHSNTVTYNCWREDHPSFGSQLIRDTFLIFQLYVTRCPLNFGGVNQTSSAEDVQFRVLNVRISSTLRSFRPGKDLTQEQVSLVLLITATPQTNPSSQAPSATRSRQGRSGPGRIRTGDRPVSPNCWYEPVALTRLPSCHPTSELRARLGGPTRFAVNKRISRLMYWTRISLVTATLSRSMPEQESRYLGCLSLSGQNGRGMCLLASPSTQCRFLRIRLDSTRR